jgi:hypothetical protein
VAISLATQLNSNNTTLLIALRFYQAGFNIIPVLTDGSKMPAVAWKRFQYERTADEMLRCWFGNREPYGIGLIHGAVSGTPRCSMSTTAQFGRSFINAYWKPSRGWPMPRLCKRRAMAAAISGITGPVIRSRATWCWQVGPTLTNRASGRHQSKLAVKAATRSASVHRPSVTRLAVRTGSSAEVSAPSPC